MLVKVVILILVMHNSGSSTIHRFEGWSSLESCNRAAKELGTAGFVSSQYAFCIEIK